MHVLDFYLYTPEQNHSHKFALDFFNFEWMESDGVGLHK